MAVTDKISINSAIKAGFVAHVGRRKNIKLGN